MFRLRHYAGDVTYDITGFKVKNMDPFNRALSQMMFEAKNPLASLLFPDGNVNVWKVGSAARIHTTAASAFKRSMRDMIDLLNSKVREKRHAFFCIDSFFCFCFVVFFRVDSFVHPMYQAQQLQKARCFRH